MINVEQLKKSIIEAKKIQGLVFVGFSNNEVYVTENVNSEVYRRFNHVLYWFNPNEIFNGEISVRVDDVSKRKGQYNLYTFDELVNDANDYETKKSLI